MTTNTENLDHAVDEHDDPHWEPEEDGDRCPLCGRFFRLWKRVRAPRGNPRQRHPHHRGVHLA